MLELGVLSFLCTDVSWSQDVGSASVGLMFSFFFWLWCGLCPGCVGCWFLFVLCFLVVFVSG